MNPHSPPAGALHGMRILDLTSVGMGPMATQLLGDMGADVIKVESPEGDVFRHVTPQRHAGMSHAFLNLNRNKRSIVIDLKDAQGRTELQQLLATADVFVSNARPAALRRLGLDYESLAKDYPRLVYCGCYGYSERGPYAGRAAIDDTIQAASGIAWLQGKAGKEAPRYVNTVVADKVAALYVSHAIVCALLARERLGRGQSVEVPMFECLVSFLAAENLAGLTFDPPIGGAGYDRLFNDYRRPFRTRDGFMSVVPYTDGQWRRFFQLIGRDDCIADPRYSTAIARSRHFGELYQLVESVLSDRSTADWEVLLDDADIPFARVNSLADLQSDPHLQATGFWQRVNHPSEGALIQPGIPVHFSATPASVRRLAPLLGEHGDEIRAELRQSASQKDRT